jgi:hypothetical protein
LRIVKGSNVKKLFSLAALAAIVGASALPAGAATQTGNVTVKWNVSVTANLTLGTDYDASGNQQTTAAIAELLSTGPGGAGEACTPPATEAAATVNFGTITPDSGLSKNVDCLYKNAVNAKVTTNSVNWSLGEYEGAALPTGATLCAYPNGFASFPATVSGAAAAVQSGRTTATWTDNTTCAASALTLGTTVANNNLATSTTQYTAAPANIGEDMALLLTPAATTGAQTVTVTFSLLAN